MHVCCVHGDYKRCSKQCGYSSDIRQLFLISEKRLVHYFLVLELVRLVPAESEAESSPVCGTLVPRQCESE